MKLTPRRLLISLALLFPVVLLGLERYQASTQFTAAYLRPDLRPIIAFDEDPLGTGLYPIQLDQSGMHILSLTSSTVGLQNIPSQGHRHPPMDPKNFLVLLGRQSSSGRRVVFAHAPMPTPCPGGQYRLVIHFAAFAEPGMLPLTKCSDCRLEGGLSSPDPLRRSLQAPHGTA
jgi:hypothetical protein